MSRLTHSIRESSNRERLLIQTNLNLEAADSSNRNLLHELDEVRNELKKLKIKEVKNSGMEKELLEKGSELGELRIEIEGLRKENREKELMEKRLKAKVEGLRGELRESREEVRKGKEEGGWMVGEEAMKDARERLKLGNEVSLKELDEEKELESRF